MIRAASAALITAVTALTSCAVPGHQTGADEDPCVIRDPAVTASGQQRFVEADDGDPCVEIQHGVWVSADWLDIDSSGRVVGVRPGAPPYLRSAVASITPPRTVDRPSNRQGGDAGQDRTPPRRTHG